MVVPNKITKKEMPFLIMLEVSWEHAIVDKTFVNACN
jgi:hypothetical protein